LSLYKIEVVERIVELIRLNMGRLKPSCIAILDLSKNTFIGDAYGELPDEIKDFYKKSSPILENMKIGDAIHHGSSYAIKISDKIAAVTVMDDPDLARLSERTLRGRINALTEADILEKENLEETALNREEYKKLNETLQKIRNGEVAADVAMSEWLNQLISSLKKRQNQKNEKT
jgi:hypothetical protein